MEKLKFISTDNQQKQFAIAVRKNVNNYFKEKGISEKGNYKLYIQTFGLLVTYIAPLVLIITVPMSALLGLIMVIIIGIGKAGIGMNIMHDGSHGSYSKKEWINKMIGRTMFLLGANDYNWKIQHNVLHHVYTNIDGYDQDIQSRGPVRFSEHTKLYKISRFQNYFALYFYGLMTIIRLFNDFKQMDKFKKMGLTRLKFNATFEFFKMLVFKSVYIFIIFVMPIMFTSFTFWQVLLGFFIMHWITGFILSIFFQMAHLVEGDIQPLPNAEGVVNNEWLVHEMQTTSDFSRNNLFLEWYAGGLNFQIEHHLFSNICHVHYKNIAPIVEQTAKEYGINYNYKESFSKAISSHLRRLKELGIKPPE